MSTNFKDSIINKKQEDLYDINENIIKINGKKEIGDNKFT
jgi:hypothetical protein